jgi:prevent-host-death family protein
MTATLEQTQTDLRKLLGLVEHGQEIIITSQGRPVAKLTGLPQMAIAPDRQAWLAKLADLRTRLATGKTGLTVEQILDEDRGQ